MGRFHEKYFLNADNENKITLEVGINPVLVQEISSADFYQTEYVEVWVQNLGTESDNGNKIFTRIHQPVPSIYPNERFPAVVAVPGGLGPGAMDHDYLAESGFVVVHFNAEGRVGNHPDDKQSQGSENFNGKIHQDDLKAIIDYVLSLPNVQTDNVGIFSNSFGITMAAGCLGRYPDLPVKYLLDNEGPSDSRVTCFDYWNDPNRTQKAYDIFGHYSTALDSSADNVAWWSEREAIHYIGKFNGYYLRIQSEFDHAQPPWFHDHAIDMINEATSTKYGGNGNCIWTRVNGSENAINTVYDQNNPPIWFSEQVERQMKAMEYIIELANMTPLTKVVNKDMNNLPKNLQLNQNFPNPFNASTTISYQLPVSNNVKLLIYNIKGQLVKTLIDDKNASGIHSIVWDGTDSLGNVVNSGVYFYKLSLNGITKSRKIILMR